MSCCGGGSGVVGLCGTCGCTPCSCNYNNIFQQGGSGSPPTAGQCVNLSGICVLDAFTANTMYFRGVDSGSAALTVSLDATNHTILLNLDLNAIAAALPQATTSQRGVGETATDAEAITKASIVNFVTPSNFAAMGASTTFAGLIEIATDAEAIAGASTTLAITPANLAATIAANYGTTTTFADAVTRAGQAPAFEGQYAAQLDSNAAYLSFGTSPGDWNSVFTFGSSNNLISGNTTINMNNFSTTYVGNGSIVLSNVDFSCNGAPVRLDGSSLILGASSPEIIDFNTVVLQQFGVSIPADSLLITGGSAGDLSNIAIVGNFLSTYSTQTYTITNAVTSRTFDAAAATLAETRNVLATLIQDLQASDKPSV